MPAPRQDGAQSGASFPLIVGGKAVGVMLFVSAEKNTFTPEFVELLQRLTDNVSFALENFDRADEKTPGRRADRISRLARQPDGPAQSRDVQRPAAPHRSRTRSATHASSRCCSSISTASRSSTIRWATRPATCCWWRSPTACAARCAPATWWRGSAVTNSSSSWRRPASAAISNAIAGELLSALSQPLQLSGHECHTTASIGIAMYPADGIDAQTLTKNADMAMYLAKEDGKNGFRFFSSDIKVQSIERLTLETGAAPCAGARAVLAALPAEGRHGDRADHRRRGAAALAASGSRHGVADAVHSAGRGDRADRADRPLGAEGSLRAEHGLAAPRPAAGVDGGQSVAAPVRRSASAARRRRGAGAPAACRRCCCSSRSPRAW